MYNSISYVEISCIYNHNDMVRSVIAKKDTKDGFVVVFRNRKYKLHYVEDVNLFYLYNKFGDLVAIIADGQFRFYASAAPEIGLELVWGLLAKMNIYPSKAF